tara:strand:- start:64593 stop:66746 length:2154 start_codon:yes stop_codon:yes gene_type:complete
MSLLNEGKANTHLTHLEELVLTQGPKGYGMARAFLLELLEELKGNSKSKVQTSVKWDGAPAIFAGVNPENGKFFVGTKSIFNKIPKINYSPEDVQRNHGHAPGLVDKLTKALRFLPSLGIEKILQGDFMFDDEMLNVVELDGEPHYTFKPNTITYAVPVDSKLGKEVGESKFGIVFHTTYDGLDSGASFGADVSGLNQVPGVWFDDAFFTDDTGTVTLTVAEEAKVKELVAAADGVNEKINYDDLPMDLLNIYINSEIKGGKFLENPEQSFEGFKTWYLTRLEKRIDSLKSEKGRMRATQKGEEMVRAFDEKRPDILSLFEVSRLLFEAKNIFISKYNNAVYNTKHFIDDGSGDLVASNPEGYVAVDHAGNGVKFVDRLEFSKANFAVDKGSKFQQAESLTVYWGMDGFSVTKSLLEWSKNLPATTNKNHMLYESLRAGVPVTSLIKNAASVKIALAEAVNWALNEQQSGHVVLIPGGFKPPHKGHYAMLNYYADNPDVENVVVLNGPKAREGVTQEMSQRLFDLYGGLDPKIRFVEHNQPMRAAFELLGNKEFVSQFSDDAVFVLGCSQKVGAKGPSDAQRAVDFANWFANNPDKNPLNVKVGVLDPCPVESADGIDLSASVMRKAARENNDELLSLHLPENVDVDDVKSILPSAMNINEFSTAAGMGGTGWGYSGRAPEVTGSEKKKRRRKKKPLQEEDELVNEVVDYLLGITVG